MGTPPSIAPHKSTSRPAAAILDRQELTRRRRDVSGARARPADPELGRELDEIARGMDQVEWYEAGRVRAFLNLQTCKRSAGGMSENGSAIAFEARAASRLSGSVKRSKVACNC